MSMYRTHNRVTSDPVGQSRTKQAFKDEVDINQILRKHEKGLTVEHLNRYQGQYGDFINAGDYHSDLNKIVEAEVAFLSIPAEIRAVFNNDPAQFLEFAQDPDNLDEMRNMGLAPPAPPLGRPDPLEGTPPVPPVNDPPLTEEEVLGDPTA